jgi:hypothetical protein
MEKHSLEINSDKPEPNGHSHKKRGSESAPEDRDALILARVNAEIKRLEAEAEARFEAELKKIRLEAEAEARFEAELKKIRERASSLMEQERAREGGAAPASAPSGAGGHLDDVTRIASKLLSDYGKSVITPGREGRADGLRPAELVRHMVRLPQSMSGIICDQILMAKREGREVSFQSIGREALLEYLARGGGADFGRAGAGAGGEKRTTHTLRLNPELSDALLVRVHTAKKMGARQASLQSMVISAIHHYMVKNRWM